MDTRNNITEGRNDVAKDRIFRAEDCPVSSAFPFRSLVWRRPSIVSSSCFASFRSVRGVRYPIVHVETVSVDIRLCVANITSLLSCSFNVMATWPSLPPICVAGIANFEHQGVAKGRPKDRQIACLSQSAAVLSQTEVHTFFSIAQTPTSLILQTRIPDVTGNAPSDSMLVIVSAIHMTTP